MSDSILILGAGELGTAVASAITSHERRGSSSISVAIRGSSLYPTNEGQISKNGHLRSLGANLVAADVFDWNVDQLASLLKPYDTVIGCLGMVAPPATQLKICRAVLQAHVKHYIPWQFGMDYDSIGRGSSQDLFTEQLDVRDMLRAQHHTQWTIVSTGLFTSFLFEPVFGVVDMTSKTPKVAALGSWDNSITVTSPVDIGRVVAEIVLKGWEDVQGKVAFTAGDTVSYARIAEVVRSVTGIEPEKNVLSLDTLGEMLRERPEDTMLKYQRVFAEGRGVAWDQHDTFNHKHGITMETAADYLRTNLRSMQSKS